MLFDQDFIPELNSKVSISKDQTNIRLPYRVSVKLDNNGQFQKFNMGRDAGVLLELIDGNRDLKCITEIYNRSIHKSLSEEEVAHIINELFYKRGLLSDSKVSHPTIITVIDSNNCMMQSIKLNAFFDKRFIYAVLIFLFAIFLYFIINIGRDFSLYTIDSLDFILFLLVNLIGILIHEFGHVAAIIYKKQKTKGIKLGIRGIRICCFTDMSDLNGASKKDYMTIYLSGIYFQLIYITLLICFSILCRLDWMCLNVFYSIYCISIMLMPGAKGDGFRFIMEMCDGNKADNRYLIFKFLSIMLYCVCILYGLFIFFILFKKVIVNGVRDFFAVPPLIFFAAYSINLFRLALRDFINVIRYFFNK